MNLRLRLRNLLRLERFERELDDEMRLHLELKAEENLESGMPPDQARQAALRSFGNPVLLREKSRDVWILRSLGSLGQDIHYAFRTLWRSPGFCLVAILSLGLGIGATTAVFTLIDVIALRKLPVARPEQLLVFGKTVPRGIDISFSYQAFREFSEPNDEFAGVLAAGNSRRIPLRISGSELELAHCKHVSGNYFSLLGIGAVAGRFFGPDEDLLPHGSPVAVVSQGYWRRRFGADTGVIGRLLDVQGRTFTIIGVAPPGFFGESVGESPDIWMPIATVPQAPEWLWKGHSVTWLRIMGRLKPEAGLARARARVEPIFQRMQSEQLKGMDNKKWREALQAQRLRLEEGGRGFSELRALSEQPLRVLFALVTLLLLAACVNMASLLLGRSAARRREIAIRASLGAGRLRLCRQLVTESVCLASGAGALGLFFAVWASQLLMTWISTAPLPVRLDVELGARGFLFASAVSALTGILFGLAPSITATRPDLTSTLNGTGPRTTTSRTALRLGKGLVVAQVALSIPLLVATGLFIRSLNELRKVDLGFDHHRVLLVGIHAQGTRYPPDRLPALYREMLDRFSGFPGVRSASLSTNSLLTGDMWGNTVTVEGYTPPPGERAHTFANAVGFAYFETMGIPLLAGRTFGPEDHERASRVAIVNETFARTYFGSENAVGRRFGLGSPPREGMMEIVGVVRDGKYRAVREARLPMIYLPFTQLRTPMRELQLRTIGADPLAIAEGVRAQLRSLEPNLPITGMTTLSAQVDASLMGERLLASLSSYFGFMALLLASIGVFGIMSFAVVRRTNEIGIRMALGATRTGELARILREAAGLLLGGIALGIVLALAAAHAASGLIADLLFQLQPTDVVTIALVSILLLGFGLLAGYLPARRAARVDPMVALRIE